MEIKIFQRFIELGLSVVGCNEDKTAVISWTAFQKKMPTSNDLNVFIQKKAKKIAVICGEVSGNLICLDFDIKNHPDPEGIWNEVWGKIVDYFGGDASHLCLVKTPSGGYHLWFRAENVGSNKKLAGRATTEEERKVNAKLKRVYFIETRGQGGYAVVPPSEGYEFVIGSFERIPVLKAFELDDILDICKSFNQIDEEQIEYRPKNVPVHIYKDAPWDMYNADKSNPHLKILLEAGWEKMATIGSRTHFKRPGSTNKWSANWCEEKRLFYVFTTNSEFESDCAYTPFTIYKTLAHNGDKREAIKALRQAGYGSPWTDKETDMIQTVAIELDKGKMFEDIILQFSDLQVKEPSDQKKIHLAAISINKVKQGIFWKRSKRGGLVVDKNSLFNFLQYPTDGLQKYWRIVLLADTVQSMAYRLCLVNEESKIIKQVTLKLIKEQIFNWIEAFDFSEYDVSPAEIKNLLLDITDSVWTNILEYIPITPIDDLNFLRDEKNKAYHFFLNNVVTVTPENILCSPYDSFKGDTYIWEEKIIKRNYNELSIDYGKIYNSYLARFFRRLSGYTPTTDAMFNFNPKDRKELTLLESFYSFTTIFGYLITNYKDPDKPYCIIIAEDTEDDGNGGGTGKGLFMKCVSQIRNACVIDGKNWQPDKPFAFQRVDLNTDVISIEDTEKYFNFRKLYNLITEGIEIEKKNKNSFHLNYEYSPKITITTNYDLLENSVHTIRRVKKLLLSRYFNVNLTPRMEFDGKNFFYDWDDQDWNDFYTFSFLCIQFFYQNDIQQSVDTENTIIKAIKLKAGTYGNEFYNYCMDHIYDKLSIEPKYGVKKFYMDFMDEFNLDKKDLHMKHFKEAVFFFCQKKKIDCEIKRDNNLDPVTGKKGLENFWFSKAGVKKREEVEIEEEVEGLPF